jgi:hypothetical protein
MSKNTNNNDVQQNTNTSSEPDDTNEIEKSQSVYPTEEDLKKRLQELRKRDPFIYR